jgi:hypothetical protein
VLFAFLRTAALQDPHGGIEGGMAIFHRMREHFRQGSQRILDRTAAFPPRENAIGHGLHFFSGDGGNIFLAEGGKQVEAKGGLIEIVRALLAVRLDVGVEPVSEVRLEGSPLLLVFDFELPQGNPGLDLLGRGLGCALAGANALGLALALVVDEDPVLAFVLFDFDGHTAVSFR